MQGLVDVAVIKLMVLASVVCVVAVYLGQIGRNSSGQFWRRRSTYAHCNGRGRVLSITNGAVFASAWGHSASSDTRSL